MASFRRKRCDWIALPSTVDPAPVHARLPASRSQLCALLQARQVRHCHRRRCVLMTASFVLVAQPAGLAALLLGQCLLYGSLPTAPPAPPSGAGFRPSTPPPPPQVRPPGSTPTARGIAADSLHPLLLSAACAWLLCRVRPCTTALLHLHNFLAAAPDTAHAAALPASLAAMSGIALWRSLLPAAHLGLSRASASSLRLTHIAAPPHSHARCPPPRACAARLTRSCPPLWC